MEPKQYKAGRSTYLMYIGIIAFWLLFAAAGAVWSKTSFWYLVPAAFVLLNGFKLFKKLINPSLEITDEKLSIYNPLTSAPYETAPFKNIVSIRSEGEKKIELVFQNSIPQEVYIGELSEEDRKDFKAELERRTGIKIV